MDQAGDVLRVRLEEIFQTVVGDHLRPLQVWQGIEGAKAHVERDGNLPLFMATAAAIELVLNLGIGAGGLGLGELL